jgi:hypothetical protein
LEAIANPKNEFFGISKGPKFRLEEMGKLRSKYFSCSNIITISKSTRNHKDLKLLKNGGVIPKLKDMYALWAGACLLKCEMRFHIAIGTRSSKNENFW